MYSIGSFSFDWLLRARSLSGVSYVFISTIDDIVFTITFIIGIIEDIVFTITFVIGNIEDIVFTITFVIGNIEDIVSTITFINIIKAINVIYPRSVPYCW